MKIIMLAIVVSMVIFIIPDSFAQTTPITCTNLDNSSMSLTPATNSITVNWVDIDCNIPNGTSIVYTLTLDQRPNASITFADSGHIFSNLQPDTPYSVTLDVSYTEDGDISETLTPLGTIYQSTLTLAESEVPPVDEPEVPVECGTTGLPYMTLSPNWGSITVDWALDVICSTDSNFTIVHVLTVEGTTFEEVDPSNSVTIFSLQPTTDYFVQLDAYYVADGDTYDQGGVLVHSLSATITTLAEPVDEPEVPVDEPEVPVDEPEVPVDEPEVPVDEPEVPVEECVIEEDYMILTRTFNSIQVNWLELNCDLTSEVILFHDLTFVEDNVTVVHAINGYTFLDLTPETRYTVQLDIHYDEYDADGFVVHIPVGTSSQSTLTLAAPVDEPEEPIPPVVPEPCVELDVTYMTLSSTADTITTNFKVEPICEMPSDATLLLTLTRVADDTVVGFTPLNNLDDDYTFLDLDFDTFYDVTLDISYIIGDGETIVLDVTNTIDTKEEGYVEPVAGPILELEEEAKGGCSGDCTPPTIGLDVDNRRLVDNGFSYNNHSVDVIAWHTPYPLITAIVNQTNTVEIIAYDNGGIFNLDMIQFGLGLEGLGQSLHDVEVLIEVHLEPIFSENIVVVEKVVIRDRDNLIDTFTVFAVTDVVQCSDDELDNECLKITLQYSYREPTINHMMVVNVADNARNTQNFYFNDGVEVIGESMNPTPFVILPNKLTAQQTEDLTLTLYRTDKINHIWMDGNGIEYLKTGENNFDRITPPEPYTCNDTPLDEINVPTRSNCHFRALLSFWNN